jgi:hypothetical protein
VLLVHAGGTGFAVDTPLRDSAGKIVPNLTRVSLPPGTSRQWTELMINPGSPALFDVVLKDMPRSD